MQTSMFKGSYCSGEKADKSMNFNTVSELLMIMDGTCIYLAKFALGLARTYGVEVSQGAMLSMVISIIVLSIGAPGIPGSELICLSVLLTQLGVPIKKG